jgi:hypothetical protein
MRNSLMGLWKVMSWIAPTLLLAASAAGGAWVWLTQEDGMGTQLLVALILGSGAVAAIWQSRARGTSRLRNALDLYAAGEIALRRGRAE